MHVLLIRRMSPSALCLSARVVPRQEKHYNYVHHTQSLGVQCTPISVQCTLSILQYSTVKLKVYTAHLLVYIAHLETVCGAHNYNVFLASAPPERRGTVPKATYVLLVARAMMHDDAYQARALAALALELAS